MAEMGVLAATAPDMRSTWASAGSAERGTPMIPTKTADQPDIDPRRVGGASQVPTPQHELTVLATVAHELRGPLTAIATSSELLAEDFLRLDPEQVKSMLAAMHRRTLWLQGLVENLLCAATIREGRLQLYRQSLTMTDLIEDVMAVVDPLLAQRGQRLRVRLPHHLPEVLADSRRLGQVLVNLILNASPPRWWRSLLVRTASGGTRVAHQGSLEHRFLVLRTRPTGFFRKVPSTDEGSCCR